MNTKGTVNEFNLAAIKFGILKVLNIRLIIFVCEQIWLCNYKEIN